MRRVAVRVGVAVVFIPVLVLAVRAGGIPLLALVEIMVLLGLAEFYRLAGQYGVRPRRALGLVAAAVVLGGMGGYLPVDPGRVLLLTTMVLLVAVTVRPAAGSVPGAASTLLGVVYVRARADAAAPGAFGMDSCAVAVRSHLVV
jgi:phosphatidate cytidylyltransferase